MKPRFSSLLVLGVWFVASTTLAYAQPGQVKADAGAVAIGGSVRDSTINIGIPPEQLAALVRLTADLSEAHQTLIAKLEGDLDLNQRQIRAALDILGENNIPPERLAAKLVEIAERFKDLQANASAQPGDDLKITGLKADAQKAIDAAELARADAFLAEVEAEQRHALDRLAVNASDTSARRGDIALTRLRYGEAAKHFANAAAVFPPGSAHEDKRIGYLTREANALYQQGDEFGDNDALNSAVERYKRLVELTPRERVPLDWARTQDRLGGALWRLGERERGTAKLEEAVAAYREALKERTRERVPFNWAATQNNLGLALQALGVRESGTAKLEEAVAAYREALKESTRERVPLGWATTQSNLGIALARVGVRESGTAKLEEAVAAFREALKERTRERVPLDWARTQNSLGAALGHLGEHESGTAKREEAVAAYREALKEQTRERVPLDWARTQYNLGVELSGLGARESGTAKLEEAVAAYREALKERTRERVPLDWARSLGSEGGALLLLAERRGDAAMAETALDQITTAFETMRDGGDAPGAALFERQLSGARASVARLRGR
jgi:tetratricopeptide (TPR) repeat protein